MGFLGFALLVISDLKTRGLNSKNSNVTSSPSAKQEILKVGLVADSENDNVNLQKALDQLKAQNVNFVVFLGDLTRLGQTADLAKVKQILDSSGMKYYVTAGDHDLWASRDAGEDALTNFNNVFGKSSQVVNSNNVVFIIVDNSDIYKGISDSDWQMLNESLQKRTATPVLHFVMSHMTPYHPQSSHIMGSETASVAAQAKRYMELLETNKVDGFFSGDLHFFAEFSTKGGSTSGGKFASGVRITTVGAIDEDRNFLGPRFAIVKVYSDYSWEVKDEEIK